MRKKLATAGVSITMALTGLALAPTAQAAVHPAVTYGLGPSVTVLESNTSGCQGSTQYYGAQDSRTSIDWTWSNGGHACVRVDYYPLVTSATCTYTFYVPDADATTTHLVFGYWTTDGVKHYFPAVDENVTNGFITLGSAANVTDISFQDNDGQTGTQIGWGSTAGWGVNQTC